jgi:hypothetical protein
MDSPLEGTGFEPLVPRRKGRVSKKSVEQQLDAKDEAWPTGRQRSQSHAPFYESAEPNIPAAPYCRIPGYQVSRTTASV